MERCSWPSDDSLMMAYHDEEWGVPLHDDQKHFEFLVLDAFQAGFRFVGPTICYAYMQAAGMVNDHEVGCFRWRELGGTTIGGTR